MENHFIKIKDYCLSLGLNITNKDEHDGVLVVSNESEGVNNLVLGIADPILIMEQHLLDISSASESDYKKLLQKNRDIIHGAFALDETGKHLIFRDTLQIENLDLNELEGSIHSLQLLMAEFADELISMSTNK